MLLQTFGSLILVVGVSYLLVTASWQVVLLSFAVAGVGYATWRIRKAVIRRAKIKALWKRSLEIDAMLDAMDPVYYESTRPVKERRLSGKTCVALEGPARVKDTTKAENRLSRRPGTADAQDSATRVVRFSIKELAEARHERKHQTAMG